MHLLVLSAFRLVEVVLEANRDLSQCTFWCSVLSDSEHDLWADVEACVSMHLLVLSAFRPFSVWSTSSPNFGVSMHLLVLSAFRLVGLPFFIGFLGVSMHLLVLSAFRLANFGGGIALVGLNAPFGAQCFPTKRSSAASTAARVSMHLLVLSAFRQERLANQQFATVSQCTFWCSVLSDSRRRSRTTATCRSQCTFWCSVLSDALAYVGAVDAFSVSMHLLVLSAFRHGRIWATGGTANGLNAPFGAQCFPTATPRSCTTRSATSQCTFWCSVLSDARELATPPATPAPSQCTFWCSVLSDLSGLRRRVMRSLLSQCTFWCSVLSDAIQWLLEWKDDVSQCTFWCSVLSDMNVSVWAGIAP